ncbi:MAG: hypothetical protein FWD03_07000 [Defluviitaleaceae bacterium]|nr:hypothetical protein [Defluviitaleaceae bacterium]
MKSLINIALLKEQLRRFWAIGAALMLTYLLFIVLPLYTSPGSTGDFHQLARDMVHVLSMGHNVLIFIMLVAPFCVAMALYPYHFNPSAALAFYNFPVSKKQLFWTNMAAALTLMLLPLLVFSLILLIPVYYPGATAFTDHQGMIHIQHSFMHFPAALFPRGVASGAVINTVPVVAAFFIRMAIGLLFYYSIFLLAVSVSGNRVVSVLLCGALPLIPVSIALLMQLTGSAYVFGFDSAQTDMRIGTVLAYTNPVMWEGAINTHTTFPRIWFPEGTLGMAKLSASYIGITAALISASYMCSHKRKLERTGDSVVFTAFKNACVFIVAMIGMIGFGAILMSSIHSRAGLYIGFIIGFALFYNIAQMIAEKSFNIKHKIKGLLPYGGIMAAAYIVILLITHFGMSFYVNHIPPVSQVHGISLHHHWRGSSSQNQWPSIYTDNSHAIAGAMEVHQRILDNQRYLRNVHWQTISSPNWSDTVGFPITYLMNDGTTVSRQYRLTREFMRSIGVAELMSDPAILMSQYPAFERPEVIELIRVHYWNDEGIEITSTDAIIIDRNEIESLLDAITQDLIAINADSWYTMTGGNIAPQQQWRREELSVNIAVFTDFIPEYRTPHISLRSHLGSTLEWMQQHGYLD